jgi:hypothetical protein
MSSSPKQADQEFIFGIDSTVKRTPAPPILARLGLGLMGSLLCYGLSKLMLHLAFKAWWLMLFGLLSSYALLALTVALPVLCMFLGNAYKANCPYCGSSVDAGKPDSVRACRQCQNTYVHKDGRLLKIKRD